MVDHVLCIWKILGSVLGIHGQRIKALEKTFLPAWDPEEVQPEEILSRLNLMECYFICSWDTKVHSIPIRAPWQKLVSCSSYFTADSVGFLIILNPGHLWPYTTDFWEMPAVMPEGKKKFGPIAEYEVLETPFIAR